MNGWRVGGALRTRGEILGSWGYCVVVLALAYQAFGWVTTMVFASGFLTGLVGWSASKARVSFRTIKLPYLSALVVFVLHRIEEKIAGFFAALARITGVETPGVFSVPVVLLVVMSVGGWLAIPYLTNRRSGFGAFLAWTFFACMGITEAAHFVFPFFDGGQPGYFPGMASVFVLAPLGWWGMRRLWAPQSEVHQTDY